MTDQELFDKVATHLLTQNAKATVMQAVPATGEERIACRYRTPGGLSCAVGCLIPDELYTEEIEGRAVSLEYVFFPLERVLAKIVTLNQRPLLIALQQVHDGWPVESWPGKLAGVADAARNLNYPQILTDAIAMRESV